MASLRGPISPLRVLCGVSRPFILPPGVRICLGWSMHTTLFHFGLHIIVSIYGFSWLFYSTSIGSHGPPLFDFQEDELAVPFVQAKLQQCRNICQQICAALYALPYSL